MELGPIQKKWIERLRAHPERQTTNQLGYKDDDSYKACCLGEAYVCLREHYGLEIPFIQNSFTKKFDMIDIGFKKSCLKSTSGYVNDLFKTYTHLGLRSSRGMFKDIHMTEHGHFLSLTEMNDCGYTWPQIADVIESNPSNVFTKSV